MLGKLGDGIIPVHSAVHPGGLHKSEWERGHKTPACVCSWTDALPSVQRELWRSGRPAHGGRPTACPGQKLWDD